MESENRQRAARLGHSVREFRRRAGLTQQDAARLAGLSVGGLRDIEQGRIARPRSGNLRRLATALSLSSLEVTDLLQQSDQNAMQHVRVRVLGPLAVVVDGQPIDPGSVKQRTLLALLSLSPGTPVSRETIIDALWGAHPPLSAASLVQTHISRLRKRLRPRQTGHATGLVTAAQGGYRLLVGEDQLDLLSFRSLIRRARDTYRRGEYRSALDLYQEATSLWRGDPLADLAGMRTHPAVVALEGDRESAMLEYADTAAAIGQHDQVLPLLRQMADSDPLNEAVHARFMTALAGSGHQAAALAVFEDMRRRLVDELGTDPGCELTDAHRRVLHRESIRLDRATADGSPAVTGESPGEAVRVYPINADMADVIRRIQDIAPTDTPEQDVVGWAVMVVHGDQGYLPPRRDGAVSRPSNAREVLDELLDALGANTARSTSRPDGLSSPPAVLLVLNPATSEVPA